MRIARLSKQLAKRYLSFRSLAQAGGVNTPGTSETRHGLWLRRHGIAVFLTSVSLLWGAGFVQMEDGSLPSFDRSGVAAAFASDAGSSETSERLRTSAKQGARYRSGGEQPGP
jgi:hypothetical protein